MMLRFWQEILAAFLGTLAFGVLFHVPTRYYLRCGLGGAVGWLIYLALKLGGLSPILATFFATLAVVAFSRISSFQMRCPVTIFLIPGIFPLVPGLGIYQTAYFTVANDLLNAGSTGFNTIKIAATMVLAILVGFELPAGLFRWLAAPFAKKSDGAAKH